MHELTEILSFTVRETRHLLPWFLTAIALGVLSQRVALDVAARRAFRRRSALAVLLTTCIGAFSPFCSFTVIPLVRRFLRVGVPLSAVMAFWVASPSMDPEIWALSAATFGIPIATARLVGALVLSLGAGYLVLLLERRGMFQSPLRTERDTTATAPCSASAPAPAPADVPAMAPVTAMATAVRDATAVVPCSASAPAAPCSASPPAAAAPAALPALPLATVPAVATVTAMPAVTAMAVTTSPAVAAVSLAPDAARTGRPPGPVATVEAAPAPVSGCSTAIPTPCGTAMPTVTATATAMPAMAVATSPTVLLAPEAAQNGRPPGPVATVEAAPAPVSGCSTAAPTSCGTAAPNDDDGRPWRELARENLRALSVRDIAKDFVSDTVGLGKWLLLAILLEALIVRYVPADVVAGTLGGSGALAVPLSVVVSVPLYLNGVGAIPVVAGLLGQGMSAGAAVAFLLGGALTTVPAIVAVRSVVNNRVFAVYLGVAVIGSMVVGLAAAVAL